MSFLDHLAEDFYDSTSVTSFRELITCSQTTLPFTFAMEKVIDSSQPRISISIVLFEKHKNQDLNDLWSECRVRQHNSWYGAARMLITSIRDNSQRQFGNIVIVPSFEAARKVRKGFVKQDEIDHIVVDSNLEPNEIRAAMYLNNRKITGENKTNLVEAGAIIYNNELYVHPVHQLYFAKAVIDESTP